MILTLASRWACESQSQSKQPKTVSELAKSLNCARFVRTSCWIPSMLSSGQRRGIGKMNWGRRAFKIRSSKRQRQTRQCQTATMCASFAYLLHLAPLSPGGFAFSKVATPACPEIAVDMSSCQLLGPRKIFHALGIVKVKPPGDRRF